MCRSRRRPPGQPPSAERVLRDWRGPGGHQGPVGRRRHAEPRDPPHAVGEQTPLRPLCQPAHRGARAVMVNRAADREPTTPKRWPSGEYYLPLAAIELRQGLDAHPLATPPGCIVISDRRLAGGDTLRRCTTRSSWAVSTPVSSSRRRRTVRRQRHDDGGGLAGIWDFMASLGEIDRPSGRAELGRGDRRPDGLARDPRRIQRVGLTEAEAMTDTSPGPRGFAERSGAATD